MSINETSTADGRPRFTPRIPVGGPPPPPPDQPPSVSISPVTGRVVAGLPAVVHVVADPGTHWVFLPGDNSWNPEPTVTYVETDLIVDGVSVVRDHRGGGGDEAVTFPSPGDHTVAASCQTSTGTFITSAPVTVHVAANVPPAFTIASPVDGTPVDLNEGGGQVGVSVSLPATDFFPVTVAIAVDGQSTVEQTSGPQYQRTVSLLPNPLGARTIAVTVADRNGLGSTQTRTVTGRDVAAPHVQVVFPAPSANVVGDANGAVTVATHGTAGDSQSGMAGGSALVAWSLTPAGPRTPAQPSSGNDFSSWTADVPLVGFGAHTIHVWATDQAGNTMAAPVEVPLDVISSFVPATLDERLSEREYLAALLSFAQEQVSVPGPPPAPLDTPTLVAALGQPVDRLSQPLSAAADRGGREVNQLRVPVELLRAFLSTNQVATDPAGEASYRNAAYTALLAAVGTSYAELRLARGATKSTRQALAARLGIRLSATAPDELDQLVLDGPALTELALENVFGLAATTDPDPLRAPSTPLLLTWQLAGLVQAWAEQDQHPNPPRAFSTLVDPDVITAGDIVAGPTSDPVRAMLARRSAQLADYAAMLAGLRTNAASPVQGLAAMRAQALPGIDLADLDAKDVQGTDISAALAGAGLTRPGFRYLRQLSQLVLAGDLTDAEWSDAAAILTGAHKASLFPAWRSEETAFVLSPDFFVVAEPGPVVSPYRVDDRARLDWQSVLRSRTTQRQDVLDANAAAVAAAEQSALPVLRDGLLAALAPSTPGDVGEEMSARFLVDMLASGSLRTTRIAQATESVQSLLSAKRTGELTATHPAAGWTVDNPDAFTLAWAWMGELGNWAAAVTAFLFPERHLDPTLLVPDDESAQPVALAALFGDIRGSGPFGGAEANGAAAKYLAAKKLAFTYLDPPRSAAHQTVLLNLSAQQSEADRREIFWAVPMLLAQRLQAAGDYQSALDWYWLVYPFDLPNPVSVYDRINAEKPFRPDLTIPPQWTTMLDPFTLVTHRSTPYTRYTVLSIIRCHVDFADSEFTRETDESIANARTLCVTARRLLDSPALQPQQPLNAGEPALAIPDLDALRARAEVQLAKLRQGRNIAGLPRSRGMATTATVNQPTAYRFKTLMDRARQLAAQAAQMEAGYLAALEKYDDRSLRVYDAIKGIDLSAAQVSLATSRVKEATDAVSAAVAQRTRASVMVSTYTTMIDAPPNQYETDLLNEFGTMSQIRDGIALADTAIGVMQAAANASSLLDEVLSGGSKAGFALGISAATVVKGGLQLQQNGLEAQIQANQLRAGIEQRRDDWRIQQTQAQQDVLVAQAQVVTATDQVIIAVQEQGVASLQHDQAVATLKFLNDQFTNADLYLWMNTTLGGVYRYFLQLATATARLAQAQLAFERAEPAQTLIRNDYWQSPAELTSGAATSRRGLTGAEQLSEDLARLDDYAFSTERRRLNLSQTFSLARLFPVEFLDFRRTGVIAFATGMALFDNDFPGHYLRLIRQVRTSLVALVPADRGIRATLSSNGISRVTTGADGSFADIVVRHDPGIVALTSPVNASGVFELDAQSDMLLPFESSGVDTTWELQLPRAANPFDYSTIVDVLVTIDYTALYDDEYRGQVVARLNADRTRGADRVFSLTRDFPDQWYDLNNPVDPANRTVTITLRELDFPLPIDGLSTSDIAVRLSGTTSGVGAPTTVTLTRVGAGAVAGGAAMTTNGIASTRRGNASSWVGLTGTTPVGDWQLTFGPDATALFTGGQLDDILLVVSWTGQGPAWPT